MSTRAQFIYFGMSLFSRRLSLGDRVKSMYFNVMVKSLPSLNNHTSGFAMFFYNQGVETA